MNPRLCFYIVPLGPPARTEYLEGLPCTEFLPFEGSFLPVQLPVYTPLCSPRLALLHWVCVPCYSEDALKLELPSLCPSTAPLGAQRTGDPESTFGE